MPSLKSIILPTILHKVTHSAYLSYIWGIFLCLLLVTQTSLAAMPIRNFNPIAQSIGMISFQSEAWLNPEVENNQALHLNFILSNQFVLPENGQTIWIDLESYHLNIQYQYRFKHWQLGIETRHVRFTEGFLDGFIDSWHDTWNMPDAGRSLVGRNRYRLYINAQYTDGEIYGSQQPISGLGDTRILISWPLSDHTHWVNQIKLPTESDAYLGSGSIDLATALHHQYQSPVTPLSFTIQYGATLVGKRDWLDQNKQAVVAQFGLAVDYAFSQRQSIGLQIDSHSETYKATNNTLDEDPFGPGFIATIGYRHRIDAWLLRAAIIEDLLPASAPDVSFLLGVSRKL